MQIRSNGNAIDDIRAPRPVGVSGPEEIERICMRNLLASSQERVFFKDLEGRFLIVSAGFVSELGRGRSLADAVGRTDFDIFSGPHAREALADEREIIRTGEPLVAKIERETFEDRPDVWVSTTKWPLRDERGEIIGTLESPVTSRFRSRPRTRWPTKPCTTR